MKRFSIRWFSFLISVLSAHGCVVTQGVDEVVDVIIDDKDLEYSYRVYGKSTRSLEVIRKTTLEGFADGDKTQESWMRAAAVLCDNNYEEVAKISNLRMLGQDIVFVVSGSIRCSNLQSKKSDFDGGYLEESAVELSGFLLKYRLPKGWIAEKVGYGSDLRLSIYDSLESRASCTINIFTSDKDISHRKLSPREFYRLVNSVGFADVEMEKPDKSPLLMSMAQRVSFKGSYKDGSDSLRVTGSIHYGIHNKSALRLICVSANTDRTTSDINYAYSYEIIEKIIGTLKLSGVE